jgi:hypothetical protein
VNLAAPTPTKPAWYALPLRGGAFAVVRGDTVTAVLPDVLAPEFAEVRCGYDGYQTAASVEVVLRDLGICARVVG